MTSVNRWNWDLVLFSCAFLTGLAIRFLAVEAVNLWNDEWHLVQFSTQPALLDFVKDYASGRNNHEPLYYLASFFLLKIALLTRFWIRFPAFFFGAIAIPAAYLLFKKILSRPIAASVSVLLAFNFFHIRYSVESRPYSLVILLSIVSLYFFWGLLREGGLVRNRVGLLVTNLLMFYTHPTMLFFSLLMYFFLAVRRILLLNREKFWVEGIRRALSNLCVPELILFSILPLLRSGLWLKQAVLKEVYPVSLHYGFSLYGRLFQYSYANKIVGALLLLCLGILLLQRRRHGSENVLVNKHTVQFFAFLLVGIFLIPALCFDVSLGLVPLFVHKYFAFLLMPLLLIVALFLEMLPPWLKNIFLILTAALCIHSSFLNLSFGRFNPDFDGLFDRAMKEKWRVVLACHAGDTVINFYRKQNHYAYNDVIPLCDKMPERDYASFFYIKDKRSFFMFSPPGFEKFLASRGYALIETSSTNLVAGFDVKEIVRSKPR